MFPRRIFSSQLDLRFLLVFSINNTVYLINFLNIQGRKYFFDFQNIGCWSRRLGGLGIWFVRLRIKRTVTIVLLVILGFLGMEVFRDNVYLFLGFGQKRGRGQGFVDRDRTRFGRIFLWITVGRENMRSEFWQYFQPKCISFAVSV